MPKTPGTGAAHKRTTHRAAHLHTQGEGGSTHTTCPAVLRQQGGGKRGRQEGWGSLEGEVQLDAVDLLVVLVVQVGLGGHMVGQEGGDGGWDV